jgi:hypothetical protein
MDRDEAKLVLTGRRRGPEVPTKHAELDRQVFVEAGATVEGAILGGRVVVTGPNTTVAGPVYARRSMSLSPAGGRIELGGGAIARDGILAEAGEGEAGWTTIVGDVHSDQVRLVRTFVFGAVFGRIVSLENCAVLGGAYASESLSLSSSLVSTFQCQRCEIGAGCYLLFLGATASDELVVRRPVTCLEFLGWDWLFDGAGAPTGGGVLLTQDDAEVLDALEDGQPTRIFVLGAARRIMATAHLAPLLQDNRSRLLRLLGRRHIDSSEAASLQSVEASLGRLVLAPQGRSTVR